MLPGMADALESGEPSAVVAFDAHGIKAKAYGESDKDFAAMRKYLYTCILQSCTP